MIPRSNLHTHSTYCDGKNSPEEIVEAAIQEKMVSLGFSGHAELSFEGCEEWTMLPSKLAEYRKKILFLKDQYAQQIEIALGIEQDYFSPALKENYDYVIGSVHYIDHPSKAIPIDINATEFCRDIQEYYGGNAVRLAEDYYSLVADVVKKTGCDIVGHFDLLTKFNEKKCFLNEENPKYRTFALDALDVVLKQDVLIEINTGAIARGHRTTPYPASFIVQRIAEKGGRLIFNSDAHSAAQLMFGHALAIEYARSFGITHLWYYQNGKFSATSIK